MLNEKEYESKLKETDRLFEKHQIRRELKSKFYNTHPKLFEGLFDLLSLSELDELFFSELMHFSRRMIQDYPGDKDDIKIKWWQEPNLNYSLFFQEIFDDYWASFLCFQHGFTKQCTEILRNTLELSLNVYFMKFCRGENDEAIIRWSAGERVEAKVLIEEVKKTEFSKAENISPHLKYLYDTLCLATHSNKKMMTSLTIPGGIWVKDKMMFEPFIVLQTRSIFVWVVETELKMIRHFFAQDKKTEFTPKILDSIGKMEEHLKIYSKVIESIKKGYIIHREQVILASGKTVLFSLKINNEQELKGKHAKSLHQEEKKELERKIQELLSRDAA